MKLSPSTFVCIKRLKKELSYCSSRHSESFKHLLKTSQPSEKDKMAKINSQTLLKGDYLLLQKNSTELENLALPNHLQLSMFVPLPLPTPGSAPAIYRFAASYYNYTLTRVNNTICDWICKNCFYHQRQEV